MQNSESSPAQKLAVKFSILRSLAIFGQFSVIWLWGCNPITDLSVYSKDWILLHIGFALLCCVLFCAGVLTSSVFTLMMRLSQTAPDSVKGTHYTTLATFEVFGKLAFAAISGYLIDTIGLKPLYFFFVILSLLTVPFIINTPKVITKSHNKRKRE